MSIDAKELQQFGLTEKESALYLAALELGSTSISDLARKSQLKRPTTYLVVNQLEVMGLLSQTRIGKRFFYSAAHPRRLVERVRFRANRAEEMMPELVALCNNSSNKPRLQVFEGLEGVKLLYQELYESLNNKQEALWFANIGALRQYVPEAITEYKKILRKIKNPKIRELNCGDKEGKHWLEETKSFRGPRHQVRILPPNFEFGSTDNLILGNKLVIFSLKGDVSVIVIENKEIALTYRTLFEAAWRLGK